mgnify:CR=1 FL=1
MLLHLVPYQCYSVLLFFQHKICAIIMPKIDIHIFCRKNMAEINYRNMIQLKNIGISFGGEYLFRNADWHVKDSDRIGIVGDNGTGKSTLMKIIAGIIQPEEGEVVAPKGTTFGYLPQDGLSLRGNTVFQEVKSVFIDLINLQHEIAELEFRMKEIPHEDKEYDGILHRYDDAMTEFDHRGGYTMDKEIARVLDGLGFHKADWNRKTEEFSGGWQMRIALAKLLLRKPDILLLDEPTNHLDLLARNWLEEYLAEYPGTVIVVSHDRYFLDVVVRRITALAFGKLHDYFTNYTGYIEEHQALVERQFKEYYEQQEEIEKLRRFINRYRADKKRVGQVSSRKKMLEKIVPIEPPKHAKTVRFRFPPPPRSGLKVIELLNISKSYGTHCVFKNINLEVQRGERIALVGENGAGKSTLMRILAGIEPLTSGERRLGTNVEFAYFDQDHAEKMTGTNTVQTELESASPPEMYSQVRNILGAFLFSGDDVEKPVSVLSGGERSRLTIAKMLLRPNNLLLLDEPTNHLDIKAKDVFLDALKDFKGTVVFVSHDRYFIDQLAQKVIEVGNGGITIYHGNYEDYLYSKGKRQAENGVKPVEVTAKAGKEKPASQSVPSKGVSKNFLKKIEELESKITEKEMEVQLLESNMAKSGFYNDKNASENTIAKYKKLKGEIDELYKLWEVMQNNIK